MFRIVTKVQASCLIARLELIMHMMRHGEKSSNVHEMANIEHTAALALDLIKEGDIAYKEVDPIVCRIEHKTVNMYRRRYDGK